MSGYLVIPCSTFFVNIDVMSGREATSALSEVARSALSRQNEAPPALSMTEHPVSPLDGRFEAWMAREQGRIYVLCLRLLRESDEADSATQDVFLKAHRALERNNQRMIRSPEKWLTRVAVNVCLDRLRSRSWKFWQRRVSEPDERLVLQMAAAIAPGPEQALLAREIARRIDRSLTKLSARQQAIFLLRHEEDRSLDEIGDILGLDLGTVKSHLSRALRKLRNELNDLYEKHTLDR